MYSIVCYFSKLEHIAHYKAKSPDTVCNMSPWGKCMRLQDNLRGKEKKKARSRKLNGKKINDKDDLPMKRRTYLKENAR